MRRVLPMVLAVLLLVSLAGNAYLWNQASTLQHQKENGLATIVSQARDELTEAEGITSSLLEGSYRSQEAVIRAGEDFEGASHLFYVLTYLEPEYSEQWSQMNLALVKAAEEVSGMQLPENDQPFTDRQNNLLQQVNSLAVSVKEALPASVSYGAEPKVSLDGEKVEAAEQAAEEFLESIRVE